MKIHIAVICPSYNFQTFTRMLGPRPVKSMVFSNRIVIHDVEYLQVYSLDHVRGISFNGFIAGPQWTDIEEHNEILGHILTHLIGV